MRASSPNRKRGHRDRVGPAIDSGALPAQLEGLRGVADIDRDGRIDVDEIYKYVSQKVSAATRGQHNPMRKSANLTGTIILGGRLE